MVDRISGDGYKRRPVQPVSKIEASANDLRSRQEMVSSQNPHPKENKDTVEISSEGRKLWEESITPEIIDEIPEIPEE